MAGIRPFRQLWSFPGQLCGNHRQSRAPDYVEHLDISPSGRLWFLNPSNITDGILIKILQALTVEGPYSYVNRATP